MIQEAVELVIEAEVDESLEVVEEEDRVQRPLVIWKVLCSALLLNQINLRTE